MTEGLPFWEPPSAVQVVAVPAEFTPAKGSQGRARALQYAAQHSEATAGDWVVHLGAASVLRERTVRAGRCPPVMRAALTRPRPAQVDAILAHVVDEAFRLSAARCGNSERHTAHYGRIAQARSPQAMRGLRDALTPPALCRAHVRWAEQWQLDRLPQRHAPRGRGARCLSVAGTCKHAAMPRAGKLTSLLLRPQYESSEAWAGVQQTFMLVPKEVRRRMCRCCAVPVR